MEVFHSEQVDKSEFSKTVRSDHAVVTKEKDKVTPQLNQPVVTRSGITLKEINRLHLWKGRCGTTHDIPIL